LIQAEAELEVRDKKGWTSLFHATFSGHANMVTFLLDNGADAEAL
jgi:ankyrin repeat protein